MGAYAVLVMAGAARPHCSYTARIAAASALGDDEHAGRMVTRMEGDKRR